MEFTGKKTFLLTVASAFFCLAVQEAVQKLTAYDAQYLDYFDTITSITICARVRNSLRNISIWQKIPWRNIMSCLIFTIIMMV